MTTAYTCLRTEGGGVQADYKLTADGRKAGDSDGLWKCSIVPHNIIEWNRLDFCVSPCTDGSDDEYPLGKVGDTYNAVFALEYQGRIATFDITLNITEQDGPAIPLSSMEKVGERVLSAHLDFSEGNTMYFDMSDILPLFGDDVEGSNLLLCVMSDVTRCRMGRMGQSFYKRSRAYARTGTFKTRRTILPRIYI